MSGEDGVVKQFYKDLGRQIRTVRMNRGLTQAVLAKQLGFTRASIANLEAGRQALQVHTLLMITSILSCKYGDIVPVGSNLMPSTRITELEGHDYVSETARHFVQQAVMSATSARPAQ
jgi:transcriptional regulator with XRE-family HTH domain